MIDRLSGAMGRFAEKLYANKYLMTIKDSFTAVIPLIIVGSIGTLGSSILCSTSTGLAKFQSFAWLAGFTSWFDTVNYATMNILALLIAYYVGYNMAKQNGRDGHFEGIISICAFICAAPTAVSAKVGEELVSVSGIGVDVTNSKGLFVAMIVGMLSIELYCRLCKIDRLKVKMPDSVPPNVANSFSALIPTILVLFGVSAVSFVFVKLTDMHLSEAIYNVLAVPVNAVFQNPICIIFCAMIAAVFWVCGLHGATIVNGVINPIVITALQTNADLVLAGQAPTEIVTKAFWTMYITMGGFGCTIGLLLAIFIASKREDDRSIAKIGFAPGLFGVNEPLIFGLPIVLNPILGIPFIIAPMACALIGYVATWLGLAAKAYIMVPWCIPPIVSGFLATGGHIGTVITQILCIIVSTLIYLPFVKMRNKDVGSVRESAGTTDDEDNEDW